MTETILPVPSDETFGWVELRVARSRIDSADSDDAPDFTPCKGTITLRPLELVSRRGGMLISRGNLTFNIDQTTGHLKNPLSGVSGKQKIQCGVWEFSAALENGDKFPSYQFTVTTTATEAEPLNIALAQPFIPPIGVSMQVMQLPPSSGPGRVLTTTETGLTWALPEPGATGTSLTPATLAETQGFWIVASPAEPVQTEMYGVPVIWVQTAVTPPDPEPGDPTEATPVEPTYDQALAKITIPTVTGVTYKRGANVVTGEITLAPSEVATITAVPASASYVFPFGVASEWTYTQPEPDEWVLRYSDDFSSGAVTPRSMVAQDSSGAADSAWVYSATGSVNQSVAVTGGKLHISSGKYEARGSTGRAMHASQVDFSFTGAEGDPNYRVMLYVCGSWASHVVTLGWESATTTRLRLAAEQDGGWAGATVPSDGSWGGLPLTGTLRAESDGDYITVYVNGAQKAKVLRSLTTNPGWAGIPTGVGVAISATPNVAGTVSFDNVRIETKP